VEGGGGDGAFAKRVRVGGVLCVGGGGDSGGQKIKTKPRPGRAGTSARWRRLAIGRKDGGHESLTRRYRGPPGRDHIFRRKRSSGANGQNRAGIARSPRTRDSAEYIAKNG